jgi:hypothetical protein
MTICKISFFVSLVALAFCLTAGYALAWQWAGAAIAIFISLAWLLAQKYSVSWLSHLCLVVSVALAVIGHLIGNSPQLMILSSGLSLAVWDLSLFTNTLGKDSPGIQIHRYEIKHFQSLALAICFGLAAALLGRQLHFKIPFILMLLCAALAVFGLNFVWTTIKNRQILIK